MMFSRFFLAIILIFLCSCTDKISLNILSQEANSLAAGVLDSSFGVGGAVQIDNPAAYATASRDDIFNAMIQDSSGNIFAVGTSDDNGTGEYNILLMKFNSTGVIDTSFGGGDGVVDINTGITANDVGSDVALLSTGEIVLVGDLGPTVTGMVFSKWNAAGTSETREKYQASTLAIDSCDTLLAKDDSAKALAINSSDQVYITGSCTQANGATNLLVTRTNASGVVDTSFSSAGTPGWFNYGTAPDTTDQEGNDIFLDSSGNPVIVGTVVNTTASTIFLIKLLADGTLDTSWGGGDGIIDDGTNGQSSRGIIDSSGRIYLVGRSFDGADWDMTIWRFTAVGVLDPTWGTGGELDFNPGLGLKARAHDIKIDASGNIVVFGFTEGLATSRDNLTIWRYTSEGVLDSSFASGRGFIANTLSNSNNDQGKAGGIHSSTGKLIVVGTIRQDAVDTPCGNANPCDINLLRFE